MADRRRLLVSLFNPEEVRAAAAGGADVIDCEDARAKVGMFKPRTIGDIAYAVRQNDPKGRLRISANIGFDLVLYQGTPDGRAVRRSLEEVEAKAAQEALGIAAAMDTGDHRPNIVKCGVDGLPLEWITPVVKAVKNALAQSYRFQDHQVVAGVLVTDMPAWEARRTDPTVIKNLVNVGQFQFDPKGKIDIKKELSEADAKAFMDQVTEDPHATLIEPYDYGALGLSLDPRERMKQIVNAIAAAQADGVMLDTHVSAKMAGIALVRPEKPLEAGQLENPKIRTGVHTVEFLKWFSEYCAYKFLETWLAGSINVEDAEKLAKLEHVDVVLNRGTSSEHVKVLFPELDKDGEFKDMVDARYSRRIRALNVTNMASKLQV